MYTFERDKMRFPISDEELERRWALVRAAMKAENVDILVMQNDHQYRSGMVRYFTDIGSLSNPVTVVFPYDDEMTLIANGGGYNPAQTPAWGCRGVKTRLGVPIFPTYVEELNTRDAQAVLHMKNIAIHPTLARNGAYISVTDNFLVTANGPERLHQFPQEIMIID
ncbi:hypothetical protein Dhaf_3416 [Desulfitobacterium hafniense DCB-2]|uniref:Creatinase N-terminal domain-containing protein n=1 Tax=Desulfitobacterium hafniense (strain DSM 10664 / DCB-2) TaxID=272564 RepID=B8FPK2_DESHD|nr:hypothetical protein [Desulfitobacterium hafniense]ACL21434.1 hypothetical protein Dhaf_3416 [Desulfitobacterium hafniense DCB-2]